MPEFRVALKELFIVHVDVQGRKNELEWQKLPKKKEEKKRQVGDVKAELSKEEREGIWHGFLICYRWISSRIEEIHD